MRSSGKYYFKIIWFLLIAVFTVYQLLVKNNKDLDIFIGASKLIFEGKTPYEIWLHSAGEGLKYFYSPLFAVLLFPLKDASQLIYDLVWLSFNYLLIYRIFTLIPFFLPTNNFSKRIKNLFLIFCIAVSARYILDNLDLGQMTFLLVWGSLESIRLIFVKKHFAGAALLAMIINFKIIPFTLLLYLIYKKEFRAAALSFFFLLICLYLPGLFLGFEFNNTLLKDWYASLVSTTANSIFDDLGRPSLSSLIPSLLMNTPVQFSIKRNFCDLDAETVRLILNSVRVALLIFVAFLVSGPFKAIFGKRALFYDLSMICLVTPIFFPHQGKYAFLYLLPAYAYCIYSLLKLHKLKERTGFKKLYLQSLIFLALSFALVTLTTDGIIGRNLSNLTEYLHFITFGTFSLLFCMAGLKPRSSTKLP